MSNCDQNSTPRSKNIELLKSVNKHTKKARFLASPIASLPSALFADELDVGLAPVAL